jgi:hypothetical protein
MKNDIKQTTDDISVRGIETVPRESIEFEGDTPCCLCGLSIPPDIWKYTCSKHEAGGWCFSAADRDKLPPIKLTPKDYKEPITGIYIGGQCYAVPCWAFDLAFSLYSNGPHIEGTQIQSPYAVAKALSEAWLMGLKEGFEKGLEQNGGSK